MGFFSRWLALAQRWFGRAVGIVNDHRARIFWAIGAFFLGSFVFVASVFYNTIPTGDYLCWVYENYRNKWPETLWAPYNQHRLVLAKLVVWVDAVVLHGAYWPVVVFTEILVLLILAMLMRQILRKVADPVSRVVVLAALCVALLRGVEIGVVRYPSNINHVLAAFCFMAGLSLIFSTWGKPRRTMVLLGLCLACVAVVCSAANGLVALPVFVGFFYLHFRWPAGTVGLGLFCSLLVVLYFIGFHGAGAESSTAPDFSSPWMIFLFLVDFVGAPWKIGAVDFSNGTYVGAALTMVVGVRYGWRLVTGKVPAYSLEGFALAILLFAAGSGFLVACGRSGLGLEQARSGRFFTVTEMMQCATVALLMLWLVERDRVLMVKRYAAPLLVATALLMVPGQIREFRDAVRMHHVLSDARTALLADPDDAQALNVLSPTYTGARADVALMMQEHIYGF